MNIFRKDFEVRNIANFSEFWYLHNQEQKKHEMFGILAYMIRV